jgi:DNA-binding transcriptional regulator YiaG
MAKKKNKSIIFEQIKLFDPEEENLDFPAICRFIRDTFKVTQEQMALKLKTSSNGYTNWEYGKRVPRGWQVFNLRHLYDQAKELANKKNTPKEAIYQFKQIRLFDPEKENLNFSSICRFIRETYSVTQQDMALKLTISFTAYGQWEYSLRTPKSWQGFNLRHLYDQAKELANNQEINKEQTSENNSQDPQQNAA